MLSELFFGVGPAIKVIFELGFEIKEEHFREFNENDYDNFRKQGEETEEKMYIIIPSNYGYVELAEVYSVSETEKNYLLEARNTIERYCSKSGLSFNSYESKLKYVAGKLPAVFSKGTKFEKYKNIKLVE